MTKALEAVLFDLDGTLLDSAPDLSHALNKTLEQDGMTPIPLPDIRPFVSQGARKMLSVAYNVPPEHDTVSAKWRHMLAFYQADLAKHSVFFDGILPLLDWLDSESIKWGIVTNKPGFLTDPLMAHYDFDKRTPCIISGDTLAQKKPHPAPVFHACDILQVNASATLFIGDDLRDIDAGKGAGCYTLAAAYGYVEAPDKIDTWNADAIIQSPHDIRPWIEAHNAAN